MCTMADIPSLLMAIHCEAELNCSNILQLVLQPIGKQRSKLYFFSQKNLTIQSWGATGRMRKACRTSVFAK